MEPCFNVAHYLIYDMSDVLADRKHFIAVSGLWYILAAHSGFSRGLASNGEELFYL
jgi:hypothetical protein